LAFLLPVILVILVLVLAASFAACHFVQSSNLSSSAWAPHLPDYNPAQGESGGCSTGSSWPRTPDW